MILVLYEKELITETFSIKLKVILPPTFINTPEMPEVCLSFVLLFTILIIVVTQKLVLQQSKNVTAKFTETLSPPPSIQYLLGYHSPQDIKSKIVGHLFVDMVPILLDLPLCFNKILNMFYHQKNPESFIKIKDT